MKPLDRNYWRLVWIVVTNGTIVLLLLSGPLRVHHEQGLLYQSMRTTAPAFSYWKELFASPWVPILAIALMIGIVAELRRSAIGPIVNLAPYIAWLVVALWERAHVEATPQELFLSKVLLIVPLAVVIVIDLSLYLLAFRRRRAGSGDPDFPSPA